MAVINLTEDQVLQLIDWRLVFEAVEQSFRSVSEVRKSDDQPTSKQPVRSFTPANEAGVLLTMPGFIGNYRLPSGDQNKVFNSLGCKLVTLFRKNEQMDPPKPNIMANILLFNENTGELKAIIQANQITAWRTAAASLVSTKYLYFRRPSVPQTFSLAILGCGVQGRIHAIGFCATEFVDSIYLWNRTKSRAQKLADELYEMRQKFRNPNLNIICADSIDESARNADVIVTATFTSTPLLFRSMIKSNVHINAVGAGQYHHSELSDDIYNDAATNIYVDSNVNAQSELKTLTAPIAGQVGDIINGYSSAANAGITIFHSMGMAVEDVAVGQAILEKFGNKHE